MDYGCIGERLSHSFSAIIHSELADYKYELCEISPENFDAFMRKADFKAINVTIPYKQAVIPYLHYIDGIAKKIGAVNTVVNRNGRLYGYNTDFYGLRELIARNGVSLKNKKVLILGSGGTSKTAAAVVEDLGAGEIYRVSRNGSDGAITYTEAYKHHTDAEVIINTTPCGMYPNIGEAAIDLEAFSHLKSVTDAVYNPLSSELVLRAREKGITASGGLYMLVAQAARAAEKFCGISVSGEKIEEIYLKLKREKTNIVLIGMPGSGKTTVGRLTAEKLGLEFTDTDDEILKIINMPIAEYFRLCGEESFRRIEADVVKAVAAKQGAVIATGGGVVLKPENIRNLKGNGKIFFLDRPIDEIAATADRPLSSSREALEKRYAERYGLYRAAADVTINAVSAAEENVRRIENEIACN